MSQKIEFQVAGDTVTGHWHFPSEGEVPWPGVLMGHGVLDLRYSLVGKVHTLPVAADPGVTAALAEAGLPGAGITQVKLAQSNTRALPAWGYPR